MRLLIDNSLSWRVARDLRATGHDVVHAADAGFADADDRSLFVKAVSERRIVVTQDADFRAIQASSKVRTGVVLMRLSDGRPWVQADALIANLPPIESLLDRGGYVTLEDGGVRIEPSSE